MPRKTKSRKHAKTRKTRKTRKHGKKGTRKAGTDPYVFEIGDQVMWRAQSEAMIRPAIMYGTIISLERDNKGALYGIRRVYTGGPRMQRRRSRRRQSRVDDEAILHDRFDRAMHEQGLENVNVGLDFFEGKLREKHLLFASDTGEGSGVARVAGDLPSPVDYNSSIHEIYNNLPTVFGNKNDFYSLYKDLQTIKFPLSMIKSFYFFESGRWDLVTDNDKVIKLPVQDYLSSLKHFLNLNSKNNLNNHRIFDYRIKDQLILN